MSIAAAGIHEHVGGSQYRPCASSRVTEDIRRICRRHPQTEHTPACRGLAHGHTAKRILIYMAMPRRYGSGNCALRPQQRPASPNRHLVSLGRAESVLCSKSRSTPDMNFVISGNVTWGCDAAVTNVAIRALITWI